MCDINLDVCQVWRETKHRARKPHRCACCRVSIQVGQEYISHFSVFDNEATSEALCLPCQADRADFTAAHSELTPAPSAFYQMLLDCIDENAEDNRWLTMRDRIVARNRTIHEHQ